MSDGRRLSIREIARRIDVPESTLRYYRNAFGAYIPTTGSGRARRHTEEAVEVFKMISHLFAAGESRETIRQRLGAARSGGGAAHEGLGAVTRPSSQMSLDSEAFRDYEIVTASDRLRPREVEHLVSAMAMRDRELTRLHNELLVAVTHLIQALEERVLTVADLSPGLSEPATAGPARQGPPPGPTLQGAELARLRETLTKERETIERLRRAKLELEQRLTRLERGKETK